jgi:hypothetical protein
MTLQEFVIFYMNKKKEAYIQLAGIDRGSKYFIKNDELAIYKWKNDKLLEIIPTLVINIHRTLMGTDVCAFCLYHEMLRKECHTCEYQKNRNQTCGSYNSDWYKLYKHFIYLSSKSMFNAKKQICIQIFKKYKSLYEDYPDLLHPESEQFRLARSYINNRINDDLNSGI